MWSGRAMGSMRKLFLCLKAPDSVAPATEEVSGEELASAFSITSRDRASKGLLGSILTKWHTMSVSARHNFLKYGIDARFLKLVGSSRFFLATLTYKSCCPFARPH